MVNKIITTLFVVIGLSFGGCGSDEGESRLETQSMLDDGNNAGVIAKLESTATTESEYIMLATAYMGIAGFGIPDIIEMVLEDDDESSDGFAMFVKKTEDKRTSATLPSLKKSSQNYKKALGNIKCTDVNISSSVENICLYMGLSEVVKSASTITYLVGDIDALDNDSLDDPKLKASACAMMYAFNGSMDTNCSKTGTDSNVTFENEVTYETLKIKVSSEYFDFLITETNATAITDGYCSKDSFASRTENNVSGYYVCPVNESSNPDDELTTVNVLVDAINNGTDSIIGAAGDNDVKQDIEEFKCDVFLGEYDEQSATCKDANNNSNVDLEKELTVEEIVDYLNKIEEE